MVNHAGIPTNSGGVLALFPQPRIGISSANLARGRFFPWRVGEITKSHEDERRLDGMGDLSGKEWVAGEGKP